MLTYCVRGERFSEGAMIDHGHVRRLLERLADLRPTGALSGDAARRRAARRPAAGRPLDSVRRRVMARIRADFRCKLT